MSFQISIIYGSVRTERQGIKLAYFLEKKLKERKYEVSFLDPLVYKLPLLDKMFKEYDPGNAPDSLTTIAGMLERSDGFMIVSGEYNHGIPPALKNLLDHFQQEFFFKPSAISCYSAGHFGGMRAAMQLRAVLAELGTPSISSILGVPRVQDNFTNEGDALNDKIEKNTSRFLDEFQWYVEAFANQRKLGTPY